ncbi:5753_t:CDS:2, partial [Dentiscutata heterogama]
DEYLDENTLVFVVHYIGGRENSSKKKQYKIKIGWIVIGYPEKVIFEQRNNERNCEKMIRVEIENNHSYRCSINPSSSSGCKLGIKVLSIIDVRNTRSQLLKVKWTNCKKFKLNTDCIDDYKKLTVPEDEDRKTLSLILKNCGKIKERYKFEFLKENISNEFYLTCYGNNLMKALIELKEDKWIRILGGECVDKCVQENNHLISKISLLSIIFDNFNELSENHPAFISSTLSKIGFVVPSTKVNSKSTSSHLSSYGKYYHLYNTSFLDILTSILWDHWINFQKSFQINFQKFQESHPPFQNLIVIPFQDLIVKPVIDFYDVGHSTTILAIPLPNFASYPKKYNFWKELLKPNYPSYSTDPNDPWNLATTYNTIDPNGTIEENSSLIEPPTATTNMFMLMGSAIAAVYIMLTDKWTGYKKPYISKALNEVLLLPEEQPSLKNIEGAVKELPNLRGRPEVLVITAAESNSNDLLEVYKFESLDAAA